jgi:hypothetical protein
MGVFWTEVGAGVVKLGSELFKAGPALLFGWIAVWFGIRFLAALSRDDGIRIERIGEGSGEVSAAGESRSPRR